MSDKNPVTFKNEFPALIREYSIGFSESCDEFHEFTDWLSSKVNKYFPICSKMLTLNKVKSPWISNDITNLIKKYIYFLAM